MIALIEAELDPYTRLAWDVLRLAVCDEDLGDEDAWLTFWLYVCFIKDPAVMLTKLRNLKHRHGRACLPDPDLKL